MLSPPRRALCGAIDIAGWSTRPIPEQIRAMQSLVAVVQTACREVGLPEEIAQSSGDGVLIMPPSDIDETCVIPDLLRGLTTALRQENRLLSEMARIRLRLAVTNGIVAAGPTGFSGWAVVECFRLLDSAPVKQALVDFPQAQLAVIVSDRLYGEVIHHGFRDLRAEEFWSVRSTIPDRGFTANAWLWVSDRVGGRPIPASKPELPPESASSDLPEEIVEARSLVGRGRYRDASRTLEGFTPTGDAERLAFLDVRADCLIGAGADKQAIADLEEILRIDPAATPSTLLRLGRCHLRVGNVQVARHTLKYLLDHEPSATEAHVELARLERANGRPLIARDHLAEAAALLGLDGLAAEVVTELLALPITGH